MRQESGKFFDTFFQRFSVVRVPHKTSLVVYRTATWLEAISISCDTAASFEVNGS